MKRWPTKPLAEIASVIRGVSFDRSQVCDSLGENSIPILRAGNIQDSLLTDSDLVYVPAELVSEEQRMKRGDLAICMSSGSPAIVGKSALLATDWNGAVGAFCAIVRFDAKVHHRFGSYWFRSPAFIQWRDGNARGANIQNLRRSELEKLSVPVPPFAEQERIVKLLDASEELRRLRTEADRRTADLIPALFYDMFGDPATNQKEWRTCLVKDLFPKDRSGARCGPFGSALKKHEYVESGIPVWGIENLQPDRFVEAGSLFITEEKYAQLTNYTVESGDILISRAGTVGRMCVARPQKSPSIIGTNLIRVALDSTAIEPGYFTALFTHFGEQMGRLRANADEGAYSFMNTAVLKSLKVPLVPLPLQRQFAARVAEIQALEAGQAESRRRLDDLFQSLLQRAFRGEL